MARRRLDEQMAALEQQRKDKARRFEEVRKNAQISKSLQGARPKGIFVDEAMRFTQTGLAASTMSEAIAKASESMKKLADQTAISRTQMEIMLKDLEERVAVMERRKMLCFRCDEPVGEERAKVFHRTSRRTQQLCARCESMDEAEERAVLDSIKASVDRLSDC